MTPRRADLHEFGRSSAMPPSTLLGDPWDQWASGQSLRGRWPLPPLPCQTVGPCGPFYPPMPFLARSGPHAHDCCRSLSTVSPLLNQAFSDRLMGRLEPSGAFLNEMVQSSFSKNLACRYLFNGFSTDLSSLNGALATAWGIACQ